MIVPHANTMKTVPWISSFHTKLRQKIPKIGFRLERTASIYSCAFTIRTWAPWKTGLNRRLHSARNNRRFLSQRFSRDRKMQNRILNSPKDTMAKWSSALDISYRIFSEAAWPESGRFLLPQLLHENGMNGCFAAVFRWTCRWLQHESLWNVHSHDFFVSSKIVE